MRSVISIAFTRTSALWILPVNTAITVAVMSSRDAWAYDTLAAFNWVTGALLLTLPLTLGAAAYDGHRFCRDEIRDVLAPTMKIGRVLGLVALAHVTSALVSWLGPAAYAVARAHSNGSPFKWAPEMVAHPLALVIALACVGVALGAVVSRPWIAPASAFGFFVVMVTAENYGPYQRFLSALGFPGWEPQIQLIKPVAYAKAAIWVVIGVGALLAWSSLGSVGRRRVVYMGAATWCGVVAVLGAIFTVFAQPPHSNGVERIDIESADLRCEGSHPEFCTIDQPRLSALFAADVAAAYEQLAGYGITPPERFVDDRLVVEPDPVIGLWVVGGSQMVDGVPTLDATVGTISRPAACPQLFDDGDPRYLGVQSIVYEWLRLTLQEPDGDDITSVARDEMWSEMFPDLPISSVDAWIPDAYHALATCDVESLREPNTP